MSEKVLILVTPNEERVEISWNSAMKHFGIVSSQFEGEEAREHQDDTEENNNSINGNNSNTNDDNTSENDETDDRNALLALQALNRQAHRVEQSEDNDDDNKITMELKYNIAALNAVAEYVRLANADKNVGTLKPPLKKPLMDVLTEPEYKLLTDAEENNHLFDLFNAAMELEIRGLVEICSAFYAQKIKVISEEARDIMNNAEKIRTLLQIDNTWTDEEQKCLEKEMRYIQSKW